MTNTATKPTLSQKAKARLFDLAMSDDSQIDTSDIAEVTDWDGAKCGQFSFFKQTQSTPQTIVKQLANHLDDDVIQILAKHNSDLDYKRINGVLRAMFAMA